MVAEVYSDGMIKDQRTPTHNVKRYIFKKDTLISSSSNRSDYFLQPPHGENLFRVVQANKELREAIAIIFKGYGLRFNLDVEKEAFTVVKFENDVMYTVPYSAVADTLQRVIFYYAAILSNKNAVLLFEEPESHFFPPYIRDLAFRIIDNTHNQYFIATHSPQLFNNLVERTPAEDIAVFATYYENYETKVRKLSDDDLSELLDYGVDVFYNLARYTHESSIANIG